MACVHGYENPDYCAQCNDEKIGRGAAAAIVKAVADEREACAKIAESIEPGDIQDKEDMQETIAAAIRARGD